MEEKPQKKQSIVDRFGVVKPSDDLGGASEDWYTDRVQDDCAERGEDGYRRRTQVQRVQVGPKYGKAKRKLIIKAVVILVVAVGLIAYLVTHEGRIGSFRIF